MDDPVPRPRSRRLPVTHGVHLPGRARPVKHPILLGVKGNLDGPGQGGSWAGQARLALNPDAVKSPLEAVTKLLELDAARVPVAMLRRLSLVVRVRSNRRPSDFQIYVAAITRPPPRVTRGCSRSLPGSVRACCRQAVVTGYEAAGDARRVGARPGPRYQCVSRHGPSSPGRRWMDGLGATPSPGFANHRRVSF